ncbi:MAG TPA: ABC transporter permease [Vicinamibacterales bacterium]|jgi:predicted permease
MTTFVQNLKYAARTLVKAPGFAFVVVLTLALGIGANTAIFTLMDQVLLRALPVKEPAQLVILGAPGTNRGRFDGGEDAFSYPMYTDFRDRGRVFSGVLARATYPLTMLYESRSERVRGELVSGNYFALLGVAPAYGRLFTSADEQAPGGHPIAVLAHGFWTTRFARDPAVVGRTIRLNGHPMTIVGVAGAGFNGLQVGYVPDVFVPLMMKAQMTPVYDGLDTRRYMWLNVMARLRPDVSREQAEAQMNVLFRQIREQELKEMPTTSARFRKGFLDTRLLLLPGHKGLSPLRDQFSAPLILLMSMVGLVLLIACANVANLLMARSPSRQREVAIRLALGASRSRIVGQLLVESLLLAVLGGAIGVLVAIWSGDLLLTILPFDNAARAFTSTPDARVLGFALVVSLLTGVLFGLAPAWQTARPQLVPALKEEGGSVVSTGHVRLRKGLVITQVALSLLLLIGAGLFARSLWNLRSLNPGFQVDHLVTFSLDPALNGYSTEQIRGFYQRLQERLAKQPGIRSVSLASTTPLTDNLTMSTITVDGYQAKEGEDMNPHVNSVGPDFFRTMGIPLIAGREFTDADGAGAPKVAIISEKMAHYFFGNSNPIGRRFGFRRATATDIEIVAVAKDGRDTSLREEIARVVYIPYQQDPDLGQMSFFVRTAGDTGVTGDSLRRVASQLDAAIPVFDVKTMQVVADESLFLERMVSLLSASFGALATLLAAIGLYGVMSYAVARRTREIGLRMALGAAQSSVVWLVMREVTTLAVVGVAIGLPAAMAVSRLIQAQLFSVAPTDPATLIGSTVTLLAVALVSGYVPARHAAQVDPMLALRHE